MSFLYTPLKRTERGHLVKAYSWPGNRTSLFPASALAKETGFAFLRTQFMFAASWALLAVGLLWPRRRTFTIAFC